ncbi:MAG: hypothetical protein ACI4F2_06445 [Acutalibacteraceae bacterium]
MNKRQAKKNWSKLFARMGYSRKNGEILSIIDGKVSVTRVDKKRPASLRKWCK